MAERKFGETLARFGRGDQVSGHPQGCHCGKGHSLYNPDTDRVLSGLMPSLVNQADSLDSPPNPTEANGAPLSVLIASGSP